MDNTRVYHIAFASVYPHYVAKAEKKGRTKEELHTIIHWLTGYDDKALLPPIDMPGEIPVTSKETIEHTQH